MIRVSFEQFLILRNLYKNQGEKLQLDINSKNFQYLYNNSLIESETDSVDRGEYVLGFVYEINGLSSITDSGINCYHTQIELYFTKFGVIASLILSTIAIIISIISLNR